MFKKIKEILNEEYVRKEAEKANYKDVTKTVDNSEEIDRKISSSSMLEKYTKLGKVMLNMLHDYKNGVYHNVPWFTIASIVVALLYVLNPLDIVPDFIPGVGYVDDFSVLTVALRFIETDIHQYLDWKLDDEEA